MDAKMNNVSSARTSTNRQNIQVTRERQMYVDGSAARKLQTVPVKKERRIYEPEVDTLYEEQPKQQVKTSPMSLGYVLMLAIAIMAVGYVLIGYVELQSDITNRINHISKMESTLNDVRLSNDEAYTKIMSSIDLEQIKDIAVNELGMRYAKEGQVIIYSGESNDYVRQYKDIPNTK